MKRTTYQVPEIRDENDNIIQDGTFGKHSAFSNATNDGAFDYILNNLEALRDNINGSRIYVKNKDALTTPGDISAMYIAEDTGKWYVWNGTTYIESDDARKIADEAIAARDAAKASQAAAKTSEQNAKTSENNAATSKQTAATSAGAAKTSEQNAGTQANTAKAWATSTTSPDGAADTASTTGKTQSAKSWAMYSKDRATASASSASAAAGSASAAKTSETNAASSKTAAATSATNAANSAKAAADSATAAATSATNASNSETQASGYKTSASDSATAAAASATSASTSATNAKAAMNTANTAASSASTSATSASTSASNAAKAEVAAKTAQAEAEKARDDAASAVAKLTGVMKYAGQVDNYSDLADVTKNKGDVWNIVNADPAHNIKAGDNVAWNGTDWDDLSGTVDLSVYAEKADYQKAITSATANGATITFNHKDGTTSTTTVNNVASATAATNDAKGQRIDTTYEKIADASNVHTSLQNSINSLSTGKQDKLTFDSTPTADSTNPVTSGGIKTALDGKPSNTGTGASGTWGINISGTASKAILGDWVPKSDNRWYQMAFSQDSQFNYDKDEFTYNPSLNTLKAGTFQGTLNGNASTATKATRDASGNVITTTYATKAELNSKQAKLTFDSTPTANSSNPVTSAGIKAAIDAVDLSNYYTKEQVDSAISNAISAITDGDSKSY